MDDPSVSPTTSQGATVQPVYVERSMRVYAIHENEAETLASLNTQSAAFFSTGWSLISAAVGVWINGMFFERCQRRQLF